MSSLFTPAMNAQRSQRHLEATKLAVVDQTTQNLALIEQCVQILANIEATFTVVNNSLSLAEQEYFKKVQGFLHYVLDEEIYSLEGLTQKLQNAHGDLLALRSKQQAYNQNISLSTISTHSQRNKI